MSEARTESRLTRLKGDVAEIKTTLANLVPLIHRIDERLTSTLRQLASKADLAELRTEVLTALADKPAAIAILLAAYGLGLAGLAALSVVTKLLH
jgi:hypothetical protein